MSLWAALKGRTQATLDPFLLPSLHKDFEASPLVIYDVGAAGGVFCPIEGGPGPRVRVHGFEPSQRSFERINRMYAGNQFVECHQAAIADQDGQVTFHELAGGRETLSSLSARNDVSVESRAIQVEGIRLDTAPARLNIPPPDFIKLDTEGSELMILKAGTGVLERDVLGIFTEISFWRFDAKRAAFFEIDRLLTDAGFVLFDLQLNRGHSSRVGGKKDKLRSGDALYLRDFSALMARLPGATREQKRTKLLKLLSLCVAWRYVNYALELIDFGVQHKLITVREFDELAAVFTSTADISWLLPNFPGREAVTRFVDVLSYLLHRDARKGVPSTFNSIGNRSLTRRRVPMPKVEIHNPILRGPSIPKIIDLSPAASTARSTSSSS